MDERNRTTNRSEYTIPREDAGGYISPEEEAEYKASDEAEGTFSDDDSHSEAVTSIESTRKSKSSGAIAFLSKWKRLLIPFGLVVAIVIVYQIISYSGRSSDFDKQQALIAAQQQRAQASKLPPVVNPPVEQPPQQFVAQPIAAPAPAVIDSQVTQTQEAMQQQLKDLVSRVEANRAEIDSLSGTLAQNQQQLTTLTQHVESLTNSLQLLTKNIHTLITPKPKPKKKSVVLAPPISYHVRAIVPGRVWLESASGQTISLRVGNQLPGYGTIQLISPRQGMVITSTGAVFQYGVNDI